MRLCGGMLELHLIDADDFSEHDAVIMPFPPAHRQMHLDYGVFVAGRNQHRKRLPAGT